MAIGIIMCSYGHWNYYVFIWPLELFVLIWPLELFVLIWPLELLGVHTWTAFEV